LRKITYLFVVIWSHYVLFKYILLETGCLINGYDPNKKEHLTI